MGTKRRRRIPVTASNISDIKRHARPKPLATKGYPKAQTARSLIRRFHVLLKQRSLLLKDGDEEGSKDAQISNRSQYTASSADSVQNKTLQQIDAEIIEMGGLEAYQRMSAAGQSNERGGGSEKVLIGWMKELGLHNQSPETDPNRRTEGGNHSESQKLRLLEVGALLPDNYQSCTSWLDSHPIDLRSRHPLIKEEDFLLLEEEQERGQWDVISLSLVLNFVPNAKDRGRMLQLAHSCLRPKTGLLFMVLPLPCVSNSRHLDFKSLYGLMSAIGFAMVRERWKDTGKVAYWLYRAEECNKASEAHANSWSRKRIVREGGTRNNFTILL